MKRRLFTAADVTPTDALLRRDLGHALDFYRGILAKAAGFRRQWQYSRGNGWILKVDDTHKALCYVIPLQDGIEVSLTLRETERAALLKDPSLHAVHPFLEAATPYPEGFALRFDIESETQYAPVARFITRLVEIRTQAAPPAARAGTRSSAGAPDSRARARRT